MSDPATLHMVRFIVGRIKGLISLDQAEWLFRTAQSLPDDACIVEIGSYLGRATVGLALGCVGSNRLVYSIDTFRGIYYDSPSGERFEQDFFEMWRDNMEEVGILEYIRPLCEDSEIVAKQWKEPIHFLFLDGSHKYETVLADYQGFYPYVVDGGIIAFHDVVPEWGGPFRVWNELARNELADIGTVRQLAYGRKVRNVS